MSTPKKSSQKNSQKQTVPSERESSKAPEQPTEKHQKTDWDAQRSADAPYPPGLSQKEKRKVRKFEAMIRHGGIPEVERTSAPESERLARIAEERVQAKQDAMRKTGDNLAKGGLSKVEPAASTPPDNDSGKRPDNDAIPNSATSIDSPLS